MRKIAAGILITIGIIVSFALAFTLYAQFALDYSLESLKQALEVSQEETIPTVDGYTYRSSLEGLVFDEISRKDVNFETVVLLEHAARSLREAVESSGYTRAGVYLAEVLREKKGRRNWALQASDSFYHFVKTLLDSIRNVWSYFLRRLHATPPTPALGGTEMLILGEAERMERSGKLEEAERYYREFLNRYPARSEHGFVSISLAQVLTRMKRFDESERLLEKVKREFSGMREETLATTHLIQIAGIRKRLARLPELENWIKRQPERIFEEKGGLDLALDYLATYQPEKALAVLEKLQQAPDPRIRTKALFYTAWIHKWQGDLEKGKEIFQILRRELPVDEKLAFASGAELAEVHYEKKEYAQALNLYEELSRKAAVESWKALSELEQGQIYLYGLNDREAARQSLLRLQQLSPQLSSDILSVRKRLEEVLQKGLREEGFRALALGHVDEALHIFEDYLKIFPRDGNSHSALGSIYLLQGLLKEAAEEAEKGYGLERNEYTAAVLGYVYEKMGRLEESSKYYSISLQINTVYLTAQYNLSWVYVMIGRYEEADQLLEKLESLKPSPPANTRAKILNNHGCVFWALGKREEAAARFQEALRVLPALKEAKDNLSLATGERPTPTFIEAPILK